tara:strand:+ start:673 stop:906 length:234 start_codon:yes stop_codon:yes gene_type:complete
MSQSDKIKEKRLDLITKVSKRKRWSFGDTNPYFDEVYSFMPKIEANTTREYKIKLKEERRKQNEVDIFTNIRNKLCV